MRGQETDHVISGPMRVLEKNCIRCLKHTDRQTDGHRNSMTDPAQRAESVKIQVSLKLQANYETLTQYQERMNITEQRERKNKQS